MSKNKKLVQKTKQCINFLIVVCILGIFAPLLLSILIIGETTPQLTIIAIVTAFIPPVFAFISYHSYQVASHKAVRKTIITKKEQWGDRWLYIGGVLSIVLIAYYISKSGGVNGHIMAYYFVFIPSATAVAFRTKLGLWIVSSTSILCLVYLYIWCYDTMLVETTHLTICSFKIPLEILHLSFAIYQIGLIVLLEYKTNILAE